MSTAKADWIAVDWGTSHMRAWVFDTQADVIAQQNGPGMGKLSPGAFEPALLDAVAHYLDDTCKTPVICCGMVGARQGWAEAPYDAVPCPPPAADTALRMTAKDPRIAPIILPGLSQSSPADVMRGEETQIAGFLSEHPDFDGVLCLPGTHTKWAQISAGEVVSFRTFMTGEVFALLTTQSVLQHSTTSDDWDLYAFDDAVSDTMSSPALLSSKLFGLRAETLLHDAPNATSRARLSGMLLGVELAGARPYWLGQRIALVGDPTLNALYAAALQSQGVTVEQAEGDAMTRAGLKAAYQSLKEIL